MAVSITLQQYLEDRHVSYNTLVQKFTHTSSKTAEAAHVAGARCGVSTASQND